MSAKERFSQELDVYTDEEWDEGSDEQDEWNPPIKRDGGYVSKVVVKREVPRG
jgi:hypothetical protein